MIKPDNIKPNYFLTELRKSVSKFPGARPLYKVIRKQLVNLLAKSIAVTYNMEGLITDKNCDFMLDQEFLKAYDAAMKQQLGQNLGGWIVHINQWAAFHAKNLKGDFVECGVYKGRLAMSNIVYTNFQSLRDRKYYLFDTFKGPDEKFSSQEEYDQYKTAYPDCYNFVVDSFKKYQNVVIVKGSVPASLSQVDIKKVAYLSIDMNCVLPELEALKYFWPRLETGGIVILDDYGQPGHERQKEAMDGFAMSAGIRILPLPTGQGMIIKPSME